MVAFYQPNSREFAKFMKSAEVAAVVQQAAERGKEFAESISPVATGTYRDSFRVDTRVVGDRQQAILMNEAPHATVVEVYLHGGLRVLGRTVDHIERSL